MHDDMNLNNYISGMSLGTSNDSACSIHVALHKDTNTFVVIKKYLIDNQDSEDYNLIQQEIITTRQLQHPNVLPYLNAFISGPNVYVLSPLMSYGSCSEIISQYFKEGLPELTIAHILRDVLCGLEYIHKKGFILRALKASHILISSDGQACICGMKYSCEVFGSGKWQKTVYSFPASTRKNLKWLSPEVLQQDLRGYNEKSDIYSLGITICELANGIVPFALETDILMLTEKVKDSIPTIIDNTTFPFDVMDLEEMEEQTQGQEVPRNFRQMANRTFSGSFHEITERCLQLNPNARPGASALLMHPFIKQCRRSDPVVLNTLKSIKPLHESFVETLENQATDLANTMGNMELDDYQWDFENT
ncbi:hypothetical protein TKK_0016900 [Trichogramma kaykai]|uniref:Protein kinase domain-containing protein n=1 Tax=Trichogramma kaykai TaxID=54128 RepID=A0ABD2W3M8_9HYME